MGQNGCQAIEQAALLRCRVIRVLNPKSALPAKPIPRAPNISLDLTIQATKKRGAVTPPLHYYRSTAKTRPQKMGTPILPLRSARPKYPADIRSSPDMYWLTVPAMLSGVIVALPVNIHLNQSSILPSVEIVTTCQGINLPLFCSAVFAAFSSPPQQGTSMRTTVTLLTSLSLMMAVSLSA